MNMPGSRIEKRADGDRFKYVVVVDNGDTSTNTGIEDDAGLIPHVRGLCQEASIMSKEEYIPCMRPAVAIVDNRDRTLYRMCAGCTDHNVRNRRARIVVTADTMPERPAEAAPPTVK